MGRLNRFIWFLVMIVIGGGTGLYYAWYVKPAEFVNAALYNLRMDYKTDYVLMVAEVYDENHDRYHALVQLDRILGMGEETEEIIDLAIRNAEGLGYAPIDLEKMHRLKEAITGQRSTATPVYDPTYQYQLEHNADATATPIPTGTPESSSGSGSSGVPAAEADPFDLGIQITTDPNAAPQLDLPAAPTITPNTGTGASSSQGTGSSGLNDGVFGDIPDDFWDGR